MVDQTVVALQLYVEVVLGVVVTDYGGPYPTRIVVARGYPA